MFEIVAAIIGVVLGAIATWWLNRSRPLFIVCEDSFRARLAIGGELWDWTSEWRSGKEQSLVSFGIGLPETKMLFRETPINTLSVLRLKFRNTGHVVVNEPKIDILLADSAIILGCDIHLEPEQIKSRNLNTENENKLEKSTITPELIYFEKNRIALTLENLYPFGINQEVTILDIFCNGEIGDINVSGRGVLQDGLIWAVKFEPWLESRKRVVKNVGRFNSINILGLLIAILGYIVVKPPLDLLTFNSRAWEHWIGNIWFTVIAAWLVLFLTYAFYMAMKGWYLNLRLPFIKRRLVIALEKLTPKK
jgi:hypothetical protein